MFVFDRPNFFYLRSYFLVDNTDRLRLQCADWDVNNWWGWSYVSIGMKLVVWNWLWTPVIREIWYYNKSSLCSAYMHLILKQKTPFKWACMLCMRCNNQLTYRAIFFLYGCNLSAIMLHCATISQYSFSDISDTNALKKMRYKNLLWDFYFSQRTHLHECGKVVMLCFINLYVSKYRRKSDKWFLPQYNCW